MSNEIDDFMQGLFDVQLKTTQQAIAKLNQMRLENAQLKREIGEFPATCWELQEQVTMLETRLALSISDMTARGREGV